jgi:tetratricopeptide (TPR) repeat protein
MMNISPHNRVGKIMKVWPVLSGLCVFFITFSVSVGAVDNPVGSGLVPPSTFSSGLVQSPNPIDTSGNLLITGNIRGGRYFRGVVPYRASSDFVAASGSVLYGSSSLDSFLRDSAGPEDFGRYTGSYGPYYSPTSTVTTTSPGGRVVITPPTAYGSAAAARFNDRIDDEFAQQWLPQSAGRLTAGQPLSGWAPAASYDRYRGASLVGWPYSAGANVGTAAVAGRPLSNSPQQLEKGLVSSVEKYRQARLAAEQTQEQFEQFQRQLQYVSDRAAELGRKLTDERDYSSLSAPETPEDILPSLELQMPAEQTQQQFDVYEQMRQQFDDYQRTSVPTKDELEQSAQPARSQPDADDQEKTSPLEGIFSVPHPDSIGTAKGEEDVDLSVRAKAILGEHKTFAGFSEDKFNQYIRAAEQYLKEGKYYRAADAYTLASIYKPDDPLAYAGKSHALFAAGEYMSSALFLSRTLEIFPEYTHFKIDLVTMLGDRDKLESRIVDARQWVQMTDAPELRFLLAYVYYQMGRLEWAKRAIDAAYEKMPTLAVTTLKEAIDQTLEESD